MKHHAVARAVMLFVGLAALGLAGCSATMDEAGPVTLVASNSAAPDKPIGTQMIGKPYKAGGRWFTPRDEPDYDESGKASWYGSELHGRRTANGERFDADMLTAAHPTLPLPSYIRVTNTKSGQQAVLRLNDRGPFARGRLIDVSRAAAEKLGFRRSGHAEVRVEYLGPAPVDGGDAETLVAEAKYGVAGGTMVAEAEGHSLRDFIPFGRPKPSKDEGGRVDVRLASITPAEARSRGESLPGVRMPMGYSDDPAPVATAARKPGEPAAVEVASLSAADRAQAYQDNDTAALDSLIEASGAEIAPVDMTPAVIAAPVAVVSTPAFEVAPEIAAEPLADVAAAAPASQGPGKGAALAPKRAAPVAPLAVVQAEPAAARIGGAHDLFAAIDANAGGSGELNGVGQ